MLALLLVLASTAAISQPPRIAFQPEHIRWIDGPPSLPAGSKIAVLEGNPREAGMFTMRVRVPAGSALAPHWHPRDERVTVLSGAAEVGFGASADRRSVTRYGAGSFYVNPPREMHYVYFAEETVLQMTGVGPWEIHVTDLTPRAANFTTARVIVRGITPHADAELDAAAEVVAKVDYDIANFRADTFYLSVQFEDEAATATRRDFLTAARGTATVRHPIHSQSKRPIRVRVQLHERTSDTTSTVAGTSDWIEYR
jgi:Cupin